MILVVACDCYHCIVWSFAEIKSILLSIEYKYKLFINNYFNFHSKARGLLVIWSLVSSVSVIKPPKFSFP